MEHEIDIALSCSAFYEVLAVGFYPPTSATLSRLLSPEAAEALAQAAAVLDTAWGTNLRLHVHHLTTNHGDESLQRLQASFARLFGHIARGPVPPYETEYGEDALFLPMQEMSDLAGFLQAFGLNLIPTAHERVDHISIECEFLLFLARKEAYARAHEDRDMQEAVQHATRLFLRDHPGRWAPAFGARLAREDPGGFYGTLGKLCQTFVSAHCRQLGVAVGPTALRLRSPSVAETPMACGTGSELLQIEVPVHPGERP